MTAYDPHPEHTALKDRLARDLAAFKAKGGRVQRLGVSGSWDHRFGFNGRLSGSDTPRLDMSLYYTESDIVSSRNKPGVLPISRQTFQRRVQQGLYNGPHAHINDDVPVWRRDYIDALAAEIRDGKSREDH